MTGKNWLQLLRSLMAVSLIVVFTTPVNANTTPSGRAPFDYSFAILGVMVLTALAIYRTHQLQEQRND